MFIIRQLCNDMNQRVPCSFRPVVWKELLGVSGSANAALSDKIVQVESDLDNQRVIDADSRRTRPSQDIFQSAEGKELVVNILTYYCKCRSIRYKQGMNEVLAPFIMLETPPLPESVIFQCFYAFINKFLPNVYSDTEFRSLQCSLRLFRLLILYHDPLLCNILDQHDMLPELYATPWFMTLFSRGLEPQQLFQLWDFFLLNDEPFLIHFVAYALLESYRDVVIETDFTNLPQVLTNLRFTDAIHMSQVCTRALECFQQTPKSFCKHLFISCFSPVTDSTAPLLLEMEKLTCITLAPAVLVDHLRSRFTIIHDSVPRPSDSPPRRRANSSPPKFRKSTTRELQYFVLDCRKPELYEAKHLSIAFNLDPELLTNPEELSIIMDGFQTMKDLCHFSLIGTGNRQRRSSVGQAVAMLSRSGKRDFLEDDESTVMRFVLVFLQKGFKYVSILEGGFPALERSAEDLQDHLFVVGTEASMAEKAKKAAGSFMDRIRSASADSYRKDEMLTANRTKRVTIDAEKLGILFRKNRNDVHIVVDSVVPGSAAAATNSIDREDALISINAKPILGLSFQSVMDLLKGASRPVRLEFEIPKDRVLDAMDILSHPIDPPVLVSAEASSLCVMWDNLPAATRYQLQIARRSDFHFNPWKTIGEMELTDTSGAVDGLEPSKSYIFRVRCGTENYWGPYSLSSAPMNTTASETSTPGADDLLFSPRERARSLDKVRFRPGSCPILRETGLFYYRVCFPVAVRATPDMEAERVDDRSLEKGSIVKCDERVARPGSLQVFVKLTTGGWAFETTQDGAVVLEPLFDYEEGYAIPAEPTLHECTKDSLIATWIGVECERYEIQVAKDGLTSRWTTLDAVVAPPETSFTISGLKPGTSYVIRLRAGDGNKKWGAYSETSRGVKTSGDEESELNLFGKAAAMVRRISKSNLEPLEEFKTPDMKWFNARNEKDVECQVVVSNYNFMVVNVKEEQYVAVDFQVNLQDLKKITSQKTKDRQFVVFQFKDTKVVIQIEQMRECIDLVKNQYRALK